MVVRLVRLWFSFIILTIPVSSAQISPIYFKNDLSNLNNSNKSYTEIVNTNNSFINGSNAIMFTKKTGFLIIFSLLQLCAMSPPSCNKTVSYTHLTLPTKA